MLVVPLFSEGSGAASLGCRLCASGRKEPFRSRYPNAGGSPHVEKLIPHPQLVVSPNSYEIIRSETGRFAQSCRSVPNSDHHDQYRAKP
jgi:hypothetical protein